MNCRTAVELLPWLLNGTLKGEERRGVLEHLEECAECRQELVEIRDAGVLYQAHPGADELWAHAAGEISDPARAELLATHLTLCRSCAEEVALIRESRTTLGGEPAGRATPAAAPPSGQAPGDRPGGKLLAGPWSVRRWQNLALAASLAAALLGGAWIWTALSSPPGEGQVARAGQDFSEEVAAQRREIDRLEIELAALRDGQQSQSGGGGEDAGHLGELRAELERLRREVAGAEERIAGLDAEVEALAAPIASAPRVLYGGQAVYRDATGVSVEDLPALSRGEGERQTLQLAPGQRLGVARVRLELVGPDGEPSWADTVALTGGISDDLTLTLRPRNLDLGTWTVRILTEDGDKELTRFGFRVVE